jgi:hypothetical protein
VIDLHDPKIRRQRRVARKPHPCGLGIARGCKGSIPAGDVYQESTQYPGYDSGQATAAGRPVRMAMCAPCAALGDPSLHALDSIPYDQLCRDGLL